MASFMDDKQALRYSLLLGGIALGYFGGHFLAWLF